MNDPKSNSSSVLVICIAVRGYQSLFRTNIDSHRRYCEKMGYRYCLVNSMGSMERWQIPWMKVALMDHALRSKFDWVMCIDADCLINESMPPLQSLAQYEQKSLFMARGFSGQVNSGVFIARDDASSRFFVRTILANCERDVPGADWGENGHVSFFARQCKKLFVLPRAWNNNTDPSEVDHIRHYCGGTRMEKIFGRDLLRRIALKLIRPAVTPKPKTRNGLRALLQDRLLYCLAQYPELHCSSNTTS